MNRWGALILVAVTVVPRAGLAQNHGPANQDFDRAVGLAEAGIGVLALPFAKLCSNRAEDRCTTGDMAMMAEVWQLLRANRLLAAGAGVTAGLFPSADTPAAEPDDLEREHSRQYLLVEGTVRFFLWSSPTWEGWAGATSGLVVVRDTFLSQAHLTDQALLGPRGSTVRTEGLVLGGALGASYPLAANWRLGGSLRCAFWSLPREPATNALGDEASLSGRTISTVVGMSLTYRVSL